MPSLACRPPALIRDLACGRVPADREAELDSHLIACGSCLAIHDEHLRPFVQAVRDLSTSNGPDTPPLPPEHIERLKQNYPANRTVVRRADSSVSETVVPTVTVGKLDRLGKFLLLAELGRGGMGCVYKARDEILNRDVALKVILLQRGRRAVTDAQRRNLFTEAQAAAKLQHPHIVPVYEAGETDDQPYLAMPLLDGETLAARMKRGRIPLADVCRIGAQVADGLAAAHEAGLLHRDIKPANLWIERLKNGTERVVILDFGLARPVADATGIAGTPAYMAPEQAAGRPLTDRADLFSLGIVLYEMVSGKQLFPRVQQSTMAHLDSVSAFDAPVPAKFLPGVPAQLAAIVAGLLRNDPARRVPGTAHKLAAKLAALATELAPGYARRRWVRTARALALILAGGVVVAGGLQCKKDYLDAPVALKRTPQPKTESTDPTAPNGLRLPTNSPGATIPLALVDGKRAKNLDRLDRLEITPDAATAAGNGDPSWVAAQVVAIIDAARKPGTDGHTGSVEAVALHPDGAILATAGEDMTVRLWDLSGTAPVQLAVMKNHRLAVSRLAFTTDGKWLVSGAADGAVIVWRVGSETPAKRYDTGEPVTALAVSRTGNRVAVGTVSSTVRVIDLDADGEGIVLRGNRNKCTGLAFANDDRHLVIGSSSKLQFIDLTDDPNKEIHSPLPEPQVSYSAIATSPDGSKFLTNGIGLLAGAENRWLESIFSGGNNRYRERQNALSVRELTNTWVTLNLLRHKVPVWKAAFTNDGNQIVTLTIDATIHLWQWSAELKHATIALAPAHQSEQTLCRDLVVHPDGRHAIVARSNGQVYVVRLRENK